ncbi:MAG: hypothetical protein ABIP95_12125 [Pelobium sp.]
MKKGTKIILWIIGIIAVIILPDANLYYQRYKLKGDKLPAIYKSYNTIDSVKDDIYEVLLIDGGNHNPVIQLNDTTIMIIYSASQETKDGSREEENSWYKIDLKGQITDSLHYAYNDRKENHNYQTFKNHIIDLGDSTYNTWILNNDKTNRPLEKLGSDKNSKEILPYQEEDRDLKYEDSTYDIDKNPTYIHRKYVKKDEWVGHTFWDSRTFSYGSGNGSGRIGWYGTSYFDVKMPKKTIHFKSPVEIEYPEEGVRDRFTYNIYKPKKGAYLMLSDRQNNRHYIIRPKLNQVSH